MIRYSKWAPTQFDDAGAFLVDRQDWFVLPVIQTRDSGELEESNFAAALKILGGESETVEVHSFNHWGPGWVEIIILHPSKEEEGREIEEMLENYPCIDADDFCERERESCEKSWRFLRVRERVELCQKWGISVFAARRDELPREYEIHDLIGH